MNDEDVATAAATRSLLAAGAAGSDDFRRALLAVSPKERDTWVDLVLGIEGVLEDGPDLPRGCVPYLPCSVNALLRMIEHAGVSSRDVFVDIGSGVGRATLLTHLLTGASAIGLEIQPHLVRAARELATRWSAARCSVVSGDAVHVAGQITTGSVFFFYCPFSGERLAKVLDALEPIARTRPIRICCVDLPLPARSWLTRLPLPFDDLTIYESTLLDPTRRKQASPALPSGTHQDESCPLDLTRARPG